MKAHELVKQGWTVGCDARDKDGEPTFADDGAATCWCAGGAIVRCYHDFAEADRMAYTLFRALPDKIREEFPTDHWQAIAAWNDQPERTKDHVIALMKGADV